ncbi:hypothetical protein L3X38_003553 [Prunus dulcis]|uniref:Uncharacterized protein n=1 Tax=Prunus dulcis TaxID=3755 RepID=A0AAD4ZM88_PRUDU|nr:hypothetical protein L3X38_003553 [Prunus dulcis]
MERALENVWKSKKLDSSNRSLVPGDWSLLHRFKFPPSSFKTTNLKFPATGRFPQSLENELDRSITNPRGIDLTVTYAILRNGSCTCECHKLRMQLNPFWCN